MLCTRHVFFVCAAVAGAAVAVVNRKLDLALLHLPQFANQIQTNSALSVTKYAKIRTALAAPVVAAATRLRSTRRPQTVQPAGSAGYV